MLYLSCFSIICHLLGSYRLFLTFGFQLYSKVIRVQWLRLLLAYILVLLLLNFISYYLKLLLIFVSLSSPILLQSLCRKYIIFTCLLLIFIPLVSSSFIFVNTFFMYTLNNMSYRLHLWFSSFNIGFFPCIFLRFLRFT